MAHDGDLGVHQGAHHGQALGATFELHRLGAPLDEASGIAQGVLHAEVEAEVGHVGDEQGRGPGAGHGVQVVVHHGHGHGEGVLEPEADIADAVAHQDDVHAGGIRQQGRGRVIGREHDQLPVRLMPGVQLG